MSTVLMPAPVLTGHKLQAPAAGAMAASPSARPPAAMVNPVVKESVFVSSAATPYNVITLVQPSAPPVGNPFDPNYTAAYNLYQGAVQAYQYNLAQALNYATQMHNYNQAVQGAGGIPQNMPLPQPPFAMNADGTMSTTTVVCQTIPVYVPTPVASAPSISAPASTSTPTPVEAQILNGLALMYAALEAIKTKVGA